MFKKNVKNLELSDILLSYQNQMNKYLKNTSQIYLKAFNM